MKKLIRMSLIALLVCGGYAAFSSDSAAMSRGIPQLPRPQVPCCQVSQ